MSALSEPLSAAGPLGGPDPVRILLLADLATVRLTLKAVLEKSGYLVEIVSNSKEAEKRIRAGRFALILCDCRKEGACGHLLELAREQAYTPATAVINVNSDEVSADADTAELSEEMLIETVDVPALLTQVAELIGRRRAQRAARPTG